MLKATRMSMVLAVASLGATAGAGAGAGVGAGALLTGCTGPVDALKVTSPVEAVQANGTKLRAVAILRGDQRAALPAGVTIEASKDGAEVHVPREGAFEYALDPGEKVERDAQGRVVAVKSGEGKLAHETRFIAGTADEQAGAHGGDVVRGELEGHTERVPLFPGDRIELQGTFAPGESVPLGGKVETSRAWSALAFGGVMLGLAYVPSIAIGAATSVDANHWLFVPIVGPWIDYAARDSCQTDPVDPTSCFADSATRIALIFDGIAQSAGFALMLVGLPSSSVVVWGGDDAKPGGKAGGTAKGGTAKGGTLRIGPMLGHAGISLSGTF